MSRPVRRVIIDQPADTSTSASLERLLDRLQAAIGELGYEPVVEDLISEDLIGGDDSRLASDEIMVMPGHMDDASRPILLAVTRGWNGKDPLSFTRVMRQVKARLIAARGGSSTSLSRATPGIPPLSRRNAARSWRPARGRARASP